MYRNVSRPHVETYVSARLCSRVYRSMRDVVVLANLAVTGYLAGLIWCIQIVHYPLFAAVGATDFPAYHRAHMTRIGAIVAVPMVVELILSALLIAFRPSAFPLWAAWGCALLTIGVWLTTFFLSVPLHGRLTHDGHDRGAITTLVATNWPRTAAWTLRLVLLVYGTLSIVK